MGTLVGLILLDGARAVAPLGVEVSPHNPSGPISTLASAQVAAVSPAVTSVELSLLGAKAVERINGVLQGDRVRILEAPGWGIGPEVLRTLS